MIRTFYYLVQMGFLVTFAALLLRQGGSFDVSFGLYRVSGQTPILLLLLLVVVSLLLLAQRVWIWIMDAPARFRRYRRDVRLTHGHRALVRSLSALVTQNYSLAAREAKRAQKMLPEFAAVPTLLMATTAEKQNQPEVVQGALQTLLRTDAHDLAVRGLVGQALRTQDVAGALQTARAALADHPKSPALLRLVYDLSLRAGEFGAACAMHRALIRARVLSKSEMNWNAVRLLTAQARADSSTARGLYEQVLDIDPGFTPAVLELSDLYRGAGKRARAQKILTRAVQHNPHPEVLRRYAHLAPDENDRRGLTRRWKYLETLLTLAPATPETFFVLAECALADGLLGKADEFLNTAMAMGPRVGFYRLRARVAEMRGDMDAARAALSDAASAPADPSWVCTQTGRRFEQWEPLVLPERFFGTISWGMGAPLVPPHTLSTLS